MQKLSEQLRLLADRAGAIEARAEAAQTEAAEKRDLKVAEAQARLQTQQVAFTARVTSLPDDTKNAWANVEESLKSAGDRMRIKAKNSVHTLEVKDAKVTAEWAEDYAYDAVQFALLAVAEAETAVLESIAARARADALAAI